MTKKIDKSLNDPQVNSWRAILETSRAIFRYLDSELQKMGSNASRFQVLFFLYFEGAHSAAELSRKLYVSRGNMSTFTKRLIEDGLIQHDEELSQKRRPFFILTRKGEKQFEKLFEQHIKNVKSVSPTLEPSEIQKLEKAKNQLQEHIS